MYWTVNEYVRFVPVVAFFIIAMIFHFTGEGMYSVSRRVSKPPQSMAPTLVQTHDDLLTNYFAPMPSAPSNPSSPATRAITRDRPPRTATRTTSEMSLTIPWHTKDVNRESEFDMSLPIQLWNQTYTSRWKKPEKIFDSLYGGEYHVHQGYFPDSCSYCVQIRTPRRQGCLKWPDPFPKDPIVQASLRHHGPDVFSIKLQGPETQAKYVAHMGQCIYRGCVPVRAAGRYSVTVRHHSTDWNGIRLTGLERFTGSKNRYGYFRGVRNGFQSGRFVLSEKDLQLTCSKNAVRVADLPECGDSVEEAMHGRWVGPTRYQPWTCRLPSVRHGSEFLKDAQFSFWGDSHGWRYLTTVASYFGSCGRGATDRDVGAMVGRVADHRDVCGVVWNTTAGTAYSFVHEARLGLEFVTSHYLNKTHKGVELNYTQEGFVFVNTGNWQHNWDPDKYYWAMLAVAKKLKGLRGDRPLVWLGVPSTHDDVIPAMRLLVKKQTNIARKWWWNTLTKAAARKYDIPYVDIFDITFSCEECATSDRIHFSPLVNSIILDATFQYLKKRGSY